MARVRKRIAGRAAVPQGPAPSESGAGLGRFSCGAGGRRSCGSRASVWRANQAARAFRNRLLVLSEVANELSTAPTFDELCRRVVELGCRRLEFDRLGLWFVADDPNIGVGSWGTDERGELRDERGQQVRATPDSRLGQVWRRQDRRCLVQRGAPLHNDAGEVVGHGVAAFAGLWDGARIIGSLNCDNLVHRRPFTADDGELLALYASTVGHLCTRKRAEEALYRSESLYRAVVESQTEFITRIDTDGRIIFANGAFTRAAGRSSETLLGLTSYDLMVDEADRERCRAILATMTPANRTHTEIQRNILADGQVHWIEWTVHGLFDAAGHLVAGQGMGRDVTDRLEMEQRLRDKRDQLRELSSNLSLAEERERRRIASALHDRLGQDLAAAMMKLGSVRQQLSEPDLATRCDEVLDTLEAVGLELSSLTFEIYPPMLYQAGFPAAVDWLVEQFEQRTGIQAVCRAACPDQILDQDARAPLFQAVRELLYNVEKHAGAHQVTVTLRVEEGLFAVTVADDGRGFDPAGLRQPRGRQGGFGLFSIEERVRWLGGSVQLDSVPGAGTRVVLRLPETAATQRGSGV